jgi:hypothetical protein
MKNQDFPETKQLNNRVIARLQGQVKGRREQTGIGKSEM